MLVFSTLSLACAHQVRALMAQALELPAAVAAVRRAVTGKDGGGGAGADAGSDSDDFVATSMIISLRCPLSGTRIETPARYGGFQTGDPRCSALALP